MARKYKEVGCSTTKTGAKTLQKRLHGQGKTARIVKRGSKFCVDSAGRRKKRK